MDWGVPSLTLVSVGALGSLLCDQITHFAIMCKMLHERRTPEISCVVCVLTCMYVPRSEDVPVVHK